MSETKPLLVRSASWRGAAEKRREIAKMDGEKSVRASIQSYLSEATSVLQQLQTETVARVISRLEEARWKEQAVFTCGNGGSATTAIHFACDLAKGAMAPGRPTVKALSLCENISLLTAWANDASYDDVFARRMAPWLKAGDVLIAISASGNSRNVLNAIHRARAARATTIGFVGFDGGKMRGMVDICITVPCNDMERIEDVHLILCHLITACLRNTPSAPAAFARQGLA